MPFSKLRKNQALRDLVAQTQLSIKDFILPYFVIEGRNKAEPIKSMPGIFRLSLDRLISDVKETRDKGIKAVLLFGVTPRKDALGSRAYSKEDIVQKATREIKREIRDIIVITDVCLCGYTTHGHCGVVKKSSQKNQVLIDNRATLKVLAKIALSQAAAGADLVAPSSMTDGQVKIIREALDKNHFKQVKILAYSAKYASNFYGPFREAADCAPQFGDRKTYQMDFRNSDQALQEMEEDITEGADIVMVKPALGYLDIVYRAKQKFNLPVAAYNVSGEYALIKAAAKSGLNTEKDTVLEILTSIKRAGADLIISYHAKEAAGWLGR